MGRAPCSLPFSLNNALREERERIYFKERSCVSVCFWQTTPNPSSVSPIFTRPNQKPWMRGSSEVLRKKICAYLQCQEFRSKLKLRRPLAVCLFLPQGWDTLRWWEWKDMSLAKDLLRTYPFMYLHVFLKGKTIEQNGNPGGAFMHVTVRV